VVGLTRCLGWLVQEADLEGEEGSLGRHFTRSNRMASLRSLVLILRSDLNSATSHSACSNASALREVRVVK